MSNYVVVSSTSNTVTVVNKPTTVVVGDSAMRGPPGPAGATGATGPQGPAGPAGPSANDAYAQANSAYAQANAAYAAANSASSAGEAYNQANAAYAQANTARDTANNSYNAANTADTIAKNAYAAANSAGSNTIVTTIYDQANTARNTANDAYGQANTTLTVSQNAYGQANAAQNTANLAYNQANSNYQSAVTRLDVTNNGVTAYRFDQYGATVDDPTLYVRAGETIAFNLNNAGHPFAIRVSNGGANYNTGLTHVDTNGIVSTGASAQGKVSGTLYWKVPYELGGNTYVYQCTVHGGMVGNIVIEPPSTVIYAQANSAYDQANAAYNAANNSGGGASLPLANGTSNIDIALANGYVTVTANTFTWTFNETNGLLELAGNLANFTACSAINFVANSSGDGAGYSTIELRPDSNATNDQYLIIDPTVSNHIHIRAGGAQDNSNAEIYLGGESSYFKVNDGENPSTEIASNSYYWTFNTNGTLTFPDTTVQTTAYVGTDIITVKKVFETTNALSSATGVVTHDCDNGHIFVHSSISANFTANFTNTTIAANNATAFTLVLNQGATAYVPTAVQIGGQAQTVNWQGGTQPAGNANKKDVVTFSVVNNNGTWITLGQLTSFG